MIIQSDDQEQYGDLEKGSFQNLKNKKGEWVVVSRLGLVFLSDG